MTANLAIGSEKHSGAEWIQLGAEFEDAGTKWQFVNGTARSLNHFHAPTTTNPTKNTLETAGLSDRATGMSAVRWAQTGVYQMELGWEDWSWQKVREHYYNYLTASTQADADSSLARTLKGLGYQMHLVQDMGHPSHVRNNTHILDGAGWKGFETWAAKNDLNIIRAEILNKKDAAGSYLYPVPQIAVDLTARFDDTHNLALVARLFDTRTYLGTKTPTTSLSQGLSEYTNGNFFSQDTIFAAERFGADTSYKYYFPYPRKNSTDVQRFIDGEKADYISKTGEGESITHLTRSGVMTSFLLKILGEGKSFYGSFKLDEACYQDYARKLIPASVGYSKAMLEYFYRGKLEVEPITASSTFQHFFVKLKNTTATGEEMTGGCLTLAIKYRLRNESGGVVTPPADTAPYYYKVVTLPGQYTVSRTQQSELTFDLGNDPLPVFATDVTLQVVYRGQLGNEAGGVAVGKVAFAKTGTDIALSLPASGVYAAATPTVSGFSRIAVNATSISDLNQSDGYFELLIKYRTAISDPFQGIPVESVPADDCTFSVIRATEANGVTSLPQGTTMELVFNLQAPLPFWASDVYIDVVYRRTDIVEEKPLAIGQLDISEPTPVDVFNNTDKVCINNQWYDSGSDEAIAVVGLDQFGTTNADVFPHLVENIYYKAGSFGLASIQPGAGSNNLASTSPFTPGSLMRLGYILTDYQFKYSLNELMTILDARDYWNFSYVDETFTGTAFVNQADRGFGGMYRMRNNLMWWGAGLIYDNEASPSESSCSWDVLQ